jgi:hypothetical protein
LTAVCTVYDIYSDKLKKKQNENLLMFSLASNFKQLVKINDSESMIRSVDAIKVIAGDFV